MKLVSRRKFVKGFFAAIALLPLASVNGSTPPMEKVELVIDQEGNATLHGVTLVVDEKHNATIRKERV